MILYYIDDKTYVCTRSPVREIFGTEQERFQAIPSHLGHHQSSVRPMFEKSGIPIPAFLPLARKKRAVLEKKSDVKRVAPADHVGVDKPFVQTGFRHGLYTLGVKDH